MSKRAPEVSVLTANRLLDGIVVFLAADGRWVESIDGALVARSAEETRALQEQGARDAARNLVVEPYLAALDEAGAETGADTGAKAGGRPLPARMRERVRVDGPSILRDVPGYVSPSPPRATPSSPHAPSARGEGRGEGQPRALTSQGQGPVTPTSAQAPAPHPNPLPARAGRGDPRAAPVEA